MGEQQSTSRTPILLSAVAVLLAAAAFAAAFYYFDGVAAVNGLVSSVLPGERTSAAVNPSPAATSEQPTLSASVPEDFALRLWQEQVDSKVMIDKLVAGDIESLRISRVESSSNDATLHVSVALSDESDATVDGVIGLRRFDDEWFVAYASMERDGVFTQATSPLPSVDDVDIELLNAMFAVQGENQGVFDEYVDGTVNSVTLKTPQPGPNTVSIDAVMHEDHGTATAQLVVVRSEFKGKSYWFITRFEKTGHDPPE